MLRARQTAEIIAENLPGVDIYVDDDLKEGYPYPVTPFSKNTEKINLKALTDNHGTRISRAFEKYIKRNKNYNDISELYIIHGNVIRYFLCRAL